MTTYETIAAHGEGESYSLLERRSDGVVVLTTNAETRRPVTPQQFVCNETETSEWLAQLTEQFGSLEAAEIFAAAAGREV